MDYSMPAWFGGLVGTVVAVAIYVPGIRFVERRLRAQRGPQTLEQRRAFEDRLSVIRRIILGAAIVLLAIAGYWIGTMLGGTR
jgi:hypothetical protein